MYLQRVDPELPVVPAQHQSFHLFLTAGIETDQTTTSICNIDPSNSNQLATLTHWSAVPVAAHASRTSSVLFFRASNTE